MMRFRFRPLLLLAALASLAALSTSAAAQAPVGTVVALGGDLEVQRGARGEWQPGFSGMPLLAGERVRTADAGAKLLFSDDSVVDLAPDTVLGIERFGGRGPRRVLLRLETGALRAIVSGYRADGARFEVETPSAIVRVQSTEFAVRFDAASKATEVLGIDGTVAVQGRTGLIGPAVAVGPNETSRVVTGKLPTEVAVAEAAARTRILAGIGLLGTGGRDGLDTNNPLLEGTVVAEADRPRVAAAAQPADGTYLKPSIPDEPLIYRLSPDIRANTQSIPVYEAVPPNEVPPGR